MTLHPQKPQADLRIIVRSVDPQLQVLPLLQICDTQVPGKPFFCCIKQKCHHLLKRVKWYDMWLHNSWYGVSRIVRHNSHKKKKKKIRGGPGTWPKRFFHIVHKLEASVIHPAISVMKWNILPLNIFGFYPLELYKIEVLSSLMKKTHFKINLT